MKVINTKLPGCYLFEPIVYGDDRGFFFEVFKKNGPVAEIVGPEFHFVQDNYSVSSIDVLRGLHFQTKKPQGKLVTVLSGRVQDVVVDLRRSSKTFGEWFSVELDSDSRHILWIPPGFAHGFLAKSETVHFFYKCTDYYDPSGESGIVWNDPDLGIQWDCKVPILSEKDTNLPRFDGS